MRWIYISPHLDDAVLSCGGLIRSQTSEKLTVEVWTVCAGDPGENELSAIAKEMHSKWGLEHDAPASRRQEDIHALQKLGARHRHLSFQDCIYRTSPGGNWLYPSDGSINEEFNPEDMPTIRTLQTFLASSLRPDDILVSPLAIGRHVDHQITRTAVDGLGRPVFYFADIPYLFNHPAELLEYSASLKSQLYPFSLQALTSWQEAINSYTSQVRDLFDSTVQMQIDIENYYRKEQGIRLWGAL